VLSRAAPYSAEVPFPATLLAASPTFHSAAVIELLESWRPDVVIFDNAGRTAQLRAAHRLGAKVVYISARRRQRRKAFRLRWMPLIDEHWIAYPEFIAGSLGFAERLKLRAFGRPRVRYLDVILSRADPAQRAAILSRAGCEAGTFVLVVPGGGTGHPGADDASHRFMTAARALAADGAATVYVGPSSAAEAAGGARPEPNWHPVGPVPQAELAELMRCARIVIANGGSTLLQAIACGSACIAVAIAGDQAERIRHCVAAGVALPADLDAAAMVQAAKRLLQDEARRAALVRNAAQLGLADGVELAVRALERLLRPQAHAGAGADADTDAGA
jgi:glycosyltransferase involved in cell wall biosynthesis